MTSEELYRSIRYAESIIESNNSKISQLEKDYDDLLALKRGLGNVFSRHEEVYSKNKAAMDDSIFETTRCMQRFRTSFVNTLDGGNATGGSSVLDTISTQASTILNKIEELESSNEYWHGQINWYYQELSKL